MTVLLGLWLAVVQAYAQTPVCNLFQDLALHDGERMTVSGDVVASPRGIILGAEECPYTYRTKYTIWPVALELTPSKAAPDTEREKLTKLKPDRTARVRGVFRGRLAMRSELRSIPARFVSDTVESIQVEALPAPAKVMPICELFRDLAAWKDKRISVRGISGSTMEGAWLSDRSCKETFVTN